MHPPEGDAIKALTDLPVDSETVTKADHEDVLWQKLQTAPKIGQAMTAGTFDDNHGKDPRYGDSAGVYGNHSYTVIGVKTRGRGKDKRRMVVLRNPWGSGEPTGDNRNKTTKTTAFLS